MIQSSTAFTIEPHLGPSPIFDARAAVRLVDLARAIGEGQMSLAELEPRQLFGVQFLRRPARPTLGQLRSEVHHLRYAVAVAVARGELCENFPSDELEQALETADRELAQSRPLRDLILPSLKRASELLTRSADQDVAVGRFTSSVICLAPVAATIWIAASGWLTSASAREAPSGTRLNRS